MKASNYHSEWAENPLLDKLAEYTDTYPLEDEFLAELDWITPDDDILFYQDIEELTETDFSDEALEAAFAGELKVAHLLALFELMEKNAKITSQAERTRMRMYRMTHKVELKRKAKRRRRQEKSGMRRKKKRIGTAAGGFSFIMAPTATVEHKNMGSTTVNIPSSSANMHSHNFNPTSNTGSTEHLSKLKPL